MARLLPRRPEKRAALAANLTALRAAGWQWKEIGHLLAVDDPGGLLRRLRTIPAPHRPGPKTDAAPRKGRPQ